MLSDLGVTDESDKGVCYLDLKRALNNLYGIGMVRLSHTDPIIRESGVAGLDSGVDIAVPRGNVLVGTI